MGVFRRGAKLWIRFRGVDGKWRNTTTGYDVGQEVLADEMLAEVIRLVREEESRPVASLPRASLQSAKSSREGWIYAVALDPHRPQRIQVKVGWTSRGIERRLSSFYQTNPRATAIGLWEADFVDEHRVLLSLSSHHLRIGSSEVFETFDPFDLVRRVGEIMVGSSL